MPVPIDNNVYNRRMRFRQYMSNTCGVFFTPTVTACHLFHKDFSYQNMRSIDKQNVKNIPTIFKNIEDICNNPLIDKEKTALLKNVIKFLKDVDNSYKKGINIPSTDLDIRAFITDTKMLLERIAKSLATKPKQDISKDQFILESMQLLKQLKDRLENDVKKYKEEALDKYGSSFMLKEFPTQNISGQVRSHLKFYDIYSLENDINNLINKISNERAADDEDDTFNIVVGIYEETMDFICMSAISEIFNCKDELDISSNIRSARSMSVENNIQHIQCLIQKKQENILPLNIIVDYIDVLKKLEQVSNLYNDINKDNEAFNKILSCCKNTEEICVSVGNIENTFKKILDSEKR